MTWISGSGTDEPTLLGSVFDLAEAAFRQGRAVERGDNAEAEQAHRESLAAVQAILVVTGNPPTRSRGEQPAPR